MTKAQLLKTILLFDDDIEIFVSYESDNYYRTLDHVVYSGSKIILESAEIPHEDAVLDMMEACYNERKDVMPDKTKANFERCLWGVTQEEINERIFNHEG